jgi:hypothetical protein
MPYKRKTPISSYAALHDAVRAAAVAGEIMLRDPTIPLKRRRRFFRLCAEMRFLSLQFDRVFQRKPARPRYCKEAIAFIKLHGFPPDMPSLRSL